MKQIGDENPFDLLHKEGFTDSEIKQLIQLRRKYIAGQMEQTPHNPPILRFVKWLGRWCVRIIFTEEVWYAMWHPSVVERKEV